MTLGDKLLHLRQARGWSQEELAEKLGVSRQSISKWETGASVPELAKIPEIAGCFGVTTDYLLLENAAVQYSQSEETPVQAGQPTPETRAPQPAELPLCDTKKFISASTVFAKRIALGVAMCVFSPVTLLALAGFSVYYSLPWLAENGAAVIGLTVLLAFVACAVALFILSGLRMQRYDPLKKGCFVLSAETEAFVQTERDSFAPRFRRMIALGVTMCILSVIPLIVCAALPPQLDYDYPFSTGFLLTVVSVGVCLMVYAGIRKESYDRLLKEGDYDPAVTEQRQSAERFGGVYWPLVVAAYLAWSFLADSWSISWVVWPVAGLLFAAISRGIGGRKDNRQN